MPSPSMWAAWASNRAIASPFGASLRLRRGCEPARIPFFRFGFHGISMHTSNPVDPRNRRGAFRWIPLLAAFWCAAALSDEIEEALRLSPDLENGRRIYGLCVACHMPEGWGYADGTYPQLAGQHRSVLIKQLEDIRAGNRDAPTMYPYALSASIGGPQALADVTGYIARLPMNPLPGRGPWPPGDAAFAAGETLYRNNCAQCHDETGEGSLKNTVPRINGQHYAYMLRQFHWIRDDRRRNADADMVRQIQGFTPEEIEQVINYASFLPLPEDGVAPFSEWQNPDFP